jgi:Holliday junction resolvase
MQSPLTSKEQYEGGPMSNKHYQKGLKKEYKVKKQLIREGFDIVQRTAGSHSPIDIIAINKVLRVIKLVQCKPESFSQSEKEKIEAEMSWLNAPFRAEFRVI